mmetsp:Transcript_36713/g.47152  ORF Transcript_36713/g.47152 Transcript_36713/m.47152 type:complete len:85 (-) Transcript_36713:309-563(-)
MAKDRKSTRSADVVSRDYTINLHKRLYKTTFKRKAPKAIRAIKAFAQKMMGTSDVRIDAKLNKFIWSKVSTRFEYWILFHDRYF